MKYANLILVLAIAGCGEDPDPPRPVDETGYMTASALYYSADQTLGSAPVDIAVVGLAGAIRQAGGVLEIRKNMDPMGTAVGVNADGSFATVVNARMSDTLVLTYTLNGRSESASIVLDDLLDQQAAPQVGTGSVPFLEANAGTGMVDVRLGQLMNPDPPYIVLNATRGVPVWAPMIVQVSLPGQSGDEVCLFKVDPTAGTQSPTDCRIVP